MAFKMTPEAQLVFFEKVFGVNSPQSLKAHAMVSQGAKFDISLYTCKVEWKGQWYQVGLTKGTTSLMKGTVDSVFAEQNKQAITKWLEGFKGLDTITPKEPVEETATVVLTGLTGNFIVLIKAIRTVTGWGLLEAKTAVDQLQLGGKVEIKLLKDVPLEEAKIAVKKLVDAGGVAHWESPDGSSVYTPVEKSVDSTPTVKKVDIPPSIQKPVNQVIPLREAKAIGQKVKGTSTGSVYYCVAISPTIRVAARIYKSGSISLRAEWEKASSSELKKLEDSGMQMKQAYGSVHFNADGVPFGRVIGAFVLGTGIAWTQIVSNSEELVIEG